MTSHTTNPRPSISVVVPFKGDAGAAEALLAALGKIETRTGDELIVVDNSRDGAFAAAAAGSALRVIEARAEAGSYYARNVGAEEASGEWILFTDADCRPRPSILDDYFAQAVDERCGALGGEVVGVADQTRLVARFARSRGHLNQKGHISASVKPFAGTANLLVRRTAWEDVGGFCEGIRTAGDQDFTWRLQDQGWTLRYAGEAIVEHAHRERVGDLLEQALRYGTAVDWLARRHPNTYRRASVARSVGGAGRVVARGAVATIRRSHSDDGPFTILDGLAAGAFALGPLISNRARRNAPEVEPQLVALVETVPAERGDDGATHVEARRRDDRPRPWLLREVESNCAEDDGLLRHGFDFARLVVRHPFGAVAAARRFRSVRSLAALAPTAKRLERLLEAGATWTVEDARRRDSELLILWLGRRASRRERSVGGTS
jgi:GT2 family glycosyltransferase